MLVGRGLRLLRPRTVPAAAPPRAGQGGAPRKKSRLHRKIGREEGGAIAGPMRRGCRPPALCARFCEAPRIRGGRRRCGVREDAACRRTFGAQHRCGARRCQQPKGSGVLVLRSRLYVGGGRRFEIQRFTVQRFTVQKSIAYACCGTLQLHKDAAFCVPFGSGCEHPNPILSEFVFISI